MVYREKGLVFEFDTLFGDRLIAEHKVSEFAFPDHIRADLSSPSLSTVSLTQAAEVRPGTDTKDKNLSQQVPLGPFSQRWAIVIALSRYADSRVPSLRYPSSDARSFYDWLVSQDGGQYAPAQVKLLLNEQATAANIRDALFNWSRQALVEDTLTIFFAGHGSPESPDSPENLFLLPYDVDYDRIAATAFPMWDIETALKRYINAKKVIVIADACHSGGIGAEFAINRRGVVIKPGLTSSGLQRLSQVSDGVAVLTASGANQLSQEGKQWGGGHGVFTHFLLEGLKGKADYNTDGHIMLGELIPYLSEQVRRATKNAQSPEVAGKFDPAMTLGK